MAYLTPWRSESSENLLHRSRTSRLDYINYIDDGNGHMTNISSQPEGLLKKKETEEINEYLKEMRRILEAYPRYGTPPEPSVIIENLYLGTTSNADNLALLRRHSIKYLLNCAGIPIVRPDREMRHYKNPSSPVIEYEELNIEAGETYDISQHFPKAHQFIEHARNRGRVLVFCPDFDRSGAIVISYLIRKGFSLLRATKMVKRARNAALFNKGFIKQVVIFARERRMLDKSLSHLGAVQFEGLMKVEERPSRSHILVIR